MRFRIAGTGFQGCSSPENDAMSSLTPTFACATYFGAFGGKSMSARDITPTTARGLAVIVAVSLVASALAPLLFVAARVVA
jgi:hypothetical protein